MKDSSYESCSDADCSHGAGTGTTTERQCEEKLPDFAIPSTDNASAKNIPTTNNFLNLNENGPSGKSITTENAATPAPPPQGPGP
jgi:hypothetical protein